MDNNKLFSSNSFWGGPFQEVYFNEKLWAYIKNLWEDPAEYKILMARRMFNLNDVLMQDFNARGNEQYLTDGIMSNTAFLLSAKAIADRYAHSKQFPRILICDDIMLHGRGILNLLDKFRKIVLNRLLEINIKVIERQLELDLSNAVSIYVFARNRDEGLLVDERKYRLYATQVLPTNRLRELSLQISDYLQSRGTANTSYVISVKLLQYQIKKFCSTKKEDLTEAFKYKGRYQSVFIRERSPHILETIRLDYSEGNPGYGDVLTSLPIYGDISGDSFDLLCNLTAHYMERNVRYSQIAIILRQQDMEIMKPKAQLLSFLYSILSMADFCRQYMNAESSELYRILVSGDFDKIISNFDKGEVFRYEIISFLKDICVDKSAGHILWYFLDHAAGNWTIDLKMKHLYRDTTTFRRIKGPDKIVRKKKYEDAEDIFYGVGMDAEYDAFRYIQTNTSFDVSKPGFDLISFRQYMYLMRKNRSEHSIGCLLGLMDSGLISMNLESFSKGNMPTLRTVLKAGEMAMYVLPRRFSVFVPALATVESKYTKVGKYVREVVGVFIDYLQNHPYEQRGRIDYRDMHLLKALKDKKPLLLYLYSAGQKFQDWDIDLRNERRFETDRLMQDEDDFSYEEERVRKHHYLLVAREFVGENVKRSRDTFADGVTG